MTLEEAQELAKEKTFQLKNTSLQLVTSSTPSSKNLLKKH